MKNLSELTLTELYFLSNGNTTMDIDAMVPELKAMSDEDRKNTIGRLIYCMPSGVGGSPIIEMFKTKLNEALTAETSSTMSLKRTVETPKTPETPDTSSDDDTTSNDTVDVDDEVVSTAEIVQDDSDDTDK